MIEFGAKITKIIFEKVSEDVIHEGLVQRIAREKKKVLKEERAKIKAELLHEMYQPGGEGYHAASQHWGAVNKDDKQ